MSPSLALATAVTFVWLGMVTAISFVEAPLKFRAPGVTLQIGLGIGRLVFRALNIAELTLAVRLGVRGRCGDADHAHHHQRHGARGGPDGPDRAGPAASAPGEPTGSSPARMCPAPRATIWYVGLEVVKVAALLTTGLLLLTL